MREVRTLSSFAIKKWLVSCKMTPGKKTRENNPNATAGRLKINKNVVCISLCSQRCTKRNGRVTTANPRRLFNSP